MKKVILGFIAGVAVFGSSFVGATLVLDTTNDQPETVEVSQSTQETSQSDTTTLTNESNVSVNETQETNQGPDFHQSLTIGAVTFNYESSATITQDTSREGQMSEHFHRYPVLLTVGALSDVQADLFQYDEQGTFEVIYNGEQMISGTWKIN